MKRIISQGIRKIRGSTVVFILISALIISVIGHIILHGEIAYADSSTRALIAAHLFDIQLEKIDDPLVGANYDYNYFGQNPSGVPGYQGGHSGIDFQTKDRLTDRLFYSVSNGVVVRAGDGDYHTISVWDEDKDISVLYLNAKEVFPNVYIGAKIEVGDTLGIQGDKGSPGAIHVHLEVRNGKKESGSLGAPFSLNPELWIPQYLEGGKQLSLVDGFDYPVGDPNNHSPWLNTNPFGASWYSSVSDKWYGGHLGDDFGGSMLETTPIKAAANGQVVFIKDTYTTTDWGLSIIIKHNFPNGDVVYTQYAHLSRIDVELNTSVFKGQQIGLAGSTGFSTGTHLHFEVKNQPVLGKGYLHNKEDNFIGKTSITYTNGSLEITNYNPSWYIDRNRSVGAVNTPLDLIFLVDTTGSMWDDIDYVKASAANIVDELDGYDYRAAVVDYRDFPVSPYGGTGDYPYNDVLGFTNNKSQIIAAINSLTLGYGGDWEESVFSGVMHSLKATTLGGWRTGATKVIIVMGDAPGHDPEPFTNYTMESVIASAKKAGIDLITSAADNFAVGSGDADDTTETEIISSTDGEGVRIFSVVIGGYAETLTFFTTLSEGTGGKVFTAETASEVPGAIKAAIGSIFDSIITASVDINPKVINLKSKGRDVTVYIQLPPELNPADIDITSIKLNDTLQPDTRFTIADHNRDGIPDLMVKFNLIELQELIGSTGEQTLVITGRLNTGKIFSGMDVIKTNLPGKIIEGAKIQNTR